MTSAFEQQEIKKILQQQNERSPSLQLKQGGHFSHPEKQLIKTKDQHLEEGGLTEQSPIEEDKEGVLNQAGQIPKYSIELPKQTICIQNYFHIRGLMQQSNHRIHRILKKERQQRTGRMFFPMQKLRPARMYSTFPSLGNRPAKQRIFVVPNGKEMHYFLHTLRVGLQEYVSQLQCLPTILVIFVNFYICERKQLRELVRILRQQEDRLKDTEIAVVTDRQDLWQNEEAGRQADQTLQIDDFQVLHSQIDLDSTIIKSHVKEYLQKIRTIGEGYDLTEDDRFFFPKQAELTELDEEESNENYSYWEQQERPAEQVCFGLVDLVEEFSFQDAFLFWEQERSPVQRCYELMPYDEEDRRVFLELA